MSKINIEGKEVVVETVVRQNYKRWNRGGSFSAAGHSLHFDFTGRDIVVRAAKGMITTPDLLIGAFERVGIVLDGSPFEVKFSSLSEDEQKRLSYGIANGRYAIVYDESGNFKTMDLAPQWGEFAKHVSNVSDQGRLKVICASYMVNHQNKEPDCYSLHADLMDFERFIKENGGSTHGYLKTKIETMVRTRAAQRDEGKNSDEKLLAWQAEGGEFRRSHKDEQMSRLMSLFGTEVYHAPNQKQHFCCVYETVVDTQTAGQVLSASPGIFVYGTPPKGYVPVSSAGQLFHNPKDFCNL